MKRIILLLVSLSFLRVHAQFAPQAGLPGSTAIHKDSSIIKAWAPGCVYVNGWLDISDINLGAVSGSNALDASGYPDGAVVSLGDMGSVTYFFENPLVDSQGYDFAIFENGFRDPLNSSMAFLEFAYVEASSDGMSWTKFPITCNLDTLNQTPMAGVYTDASKVHNLAGKYIANYGTPFDLFDLAFSSSLQLDKVHFIRITDVVGSIIENFCSRDQFNHKINDPYPTPINTGGFDLDALGIIHQKYPVSVSDLESDKDVILYPNPANDILHIQTSKEIKNVILIDYLGKKIPVTLENNRLPLHALASGCYHLVCEMQDHQIIHRTFTKW